MPDFDKIVEIIELSVVARDQHPGVDFHTLSEKKAAFKKIDADILEFKVALYEAALSYTQNIDKDDLLYDNVKDICYLSTSMQQKKNKRGKLMSQVINKFWHSELRILQLLHSESSELYDTLRKVAMSQTENDSVDFLLLHLHSTHNVCEDCRLQLAGAMQTWLYKKITDIFLFNDHIPIFHLVVSWLDAPGRAIHRDKPQCCELNMNNVATSTSLRSELTDATDPYVSIVRLEKSYNGG